jgi:trk system potassium uptake protein TrkA
VAHAQALGRANRRAGDWAVYAGLAPGFGTLLAQSAVQAAIPADSKVVGIVRGDRMIVPRGDEAIMPGDRVVVIASPASARAWSAQIAKGEREVDDLVIFGAGRMGTTIARVLLERDLRIRLVEARPCA